MVCWRWEPILSLRLKTNDSHLQITSYLKNYIPTNYICYLYTIYYCTYKLYTYKPNGRQSQMQRWSVQEHPVTHECVTGFVFELTTPAEYCFFPFNTPLPLRSPSLLLERNLHASESRPSLHFSGAPAQLLTCPFSSPKDYDSY